MYYKFPPRLHALPLSSYMKPQILVTEPVYNKQAFVNKGTFMSLVVIMTDHGSSTCQE